MFILQLITSSTLFFFINALNILTLWYLAGFYLLALGFILLLDDSDIFVGFLWVIDLGVGLIFFIFILHFSNFLHQKSYFDLNSRFFFFFLLLVFFLFTFFYLITNPNSGNLNYQLQKSWFFFITWYDYYGVFASFSISELQLLREIYFYNNSFGFFLINFMVFYGIFGAINLSFLLKRVFIFLNISQMLNIEIFNEINSTFFIRNQNFLKQQNTSTGTRVWLKKKLYKFNDF